MKKIMLCIMCLGAFEGALADDAKPHGKSIPESKEIVELTVQQRVLCLAKGLFYSALTAAAGFGVYRSLKEVRYRWNCPDHVQKLRDAEASSGLSASPEDMAEARDANMINRCALLLYGSFPCALVYLIEKNDILNKMYQNYKKALQ